MSRIGKVPIAIPAGVDVKVDGRKVSVKGPKGTLSLQLHDGIQVDVAGGRLVVKAEAGREKALSAFHGLNRALLNNFVAGVTAGFTRKLEIHGTGYQAKLVGKHVELVIGFSHPVKVPIPAGVTVEVPTPDKITVSGIDRQQVGELAAVIRRVRKPEPYQGKGIRYEGEVVRRKAGKTMGTS